MESGQAVIPENANRIEVSGIHPGKIRSKTAACGRFIRSMHLEKWLKPCKVEIYGSLDDPAEQAANRMNETKPRLQEHWQYYQSQHQTLGCKITHLIGIPLIVASIPALFFSWKIALGGFVIGWTLQFIGHYVFEKNSPVIFTEKRELSTITAALNYALKGWLSPFKNSESSEKE